MVEGSGAAAAPTPRARSAPLARALASWRGEALLAAAFLATRLALYAAGLRLNLDLNWMFLEDVEALRQHLLRSIFYFHAFAPGMNVITGALLALAPAHLAGLATAVFWAVGALMTVSLARALGVLGVARGAALALALGFSLLPQTLFLENLYLYTYLCAGLLTAAAVLFWRALQRARAASWFWFFLTCAVLGWLYTVFHLVWFVLMAALAVAAQARAGALGWRGAARRVALGAAAPALLLVGLYAKNFFVFGVFGATSWGPSNMTLATTQQMRPAERQRWIRAGKLSPYAAINVYAPPQSYLGLVPERVYPWPGSNDLVRPSTGAPNYNHGLFLEVNAARKADVAAFLQAKPGDYLRRVFTKNLPSLFHATTHWHPRDRRPESPHRQHRELLGGYERVYDALVHAWPVRHVGLYVFLPPFLGWALWAAYRRLRSADPSPFASGALLGFCVLQIFFVVSASSLFTSWETSRYRYSIEPCIFVVVVAGAAAALSGTARALRRWRSRRAGAAA